MKLYQAKNYIAIKHFYKKWKWITPDEREEIFDEVAELYADQFKVKNLAQPDVSGQRELLASAGYEYAFSTKGIDENGVPYIDERFTLANSH